MFLYLVPARCSSVASVERPSGLPSHQTTRDQPIRLLLSLPLTPCVCRGLECVFLSFFYLSFSLYFLCSSPSPSLLSLPLLQLQLNIRCMPGCVHWNETQIPKPSKIKVQGSQVSRLNWIFQLHFYWYACADTHTNRLGVNTFVFRIYINTPLQSLLSAIYLWCCQRLRTYSLPACFITFGRKLYLHYSSRYGINNTKKASTFFKNIFITEFFIGALYLCSAVLEFRTFEF